MKNRFRALLIGVMLLFGLIVAVPSASAAVNTSCPTTGASKFVWTTPTSRVAASTHWCLQGVGQSDNRRIVFRSDGILAVYSTPNTGGSLLWASGSVGSTGRLVFQNDGNAVLYSASNHVGWADNVVTPFGQKRFTFYLQSDYFLEKIENCANAAAGTGCVLSSYAYRTYAGAVI